MKSTKNFDNSLRILTILVPAINVLWFTLSVALAWPDYWKYINFEHSPLTWFSSMQLMFIAIAAFANSHFDEKLWHRLEWLGLAAAFAFFSFDEHFQIHEKLRDRFFVPKDIGTHIPGVGAGDFLFLLLIPVGGWFGWNFVKRMWKHKSVIALFAAGFAVALIATLADANHVTGVANDSPLKQFLEEMGETLAQMFFLTSFVLLLRKRILE